MKRPLYARRLTRVRNAFLMAIIAIPAMLAVCSKANAQTVTIGTGTSTDYFYGPYYRSSASSSFNYSRYAYLYTAAELGIPSGSIITQVEWDKASGTITANNTFNILMANTAATTLTTGTSWGTLTTGTTAVYGSTTQAFSTTGWVPFTLTTPYTYTGGNLIILTDHYKQGTASGSNNFRYTSASGKAIGYASSAAPSASTTLSTTYGNNRPNIRITYTAGSPCSGTPNPGNTLSSANPACPGTNFTLSLQTLPSGSGISYQWQSSATGTTYTDIPSATTTTYTTNQTSSTYYRCAVTCGSNTGLSTPVFVTMNGFMNCYCIPTLTTGCTAGDYISNFTFATINNSSGCASGAYANYGGSVTAPDLTLGSTYNTSISVGYSNQYVGAWIDYNQNGIFETSEYTNLGVVASTSTPGTSSITIPTTAMTGLTKLRLRCRWNTSFGSADACTNGWSYGETEDYDVNIVCPTISVTTNPSNNITCQFSNASFSVGGTGIGLTYQWQQNSGSGYTNLSNNSMFSGVTTSTLSITGALTSMDNYLYRCVVGTSCSSQTVTTSAGTLTVNAGVNIISSPANQIVCNNASTSFSIITAGTNLSYQWQINTGSGWSNISNGGIYSGATTTTLGISSATSSMNGYSYRCEITKPTCSTIQTSAGTLTVVVPNTSITISTANTNVCAGASTVFTASTINATNPSYQWQVNGTNVGTNSTTFTTTGLANGDIVRCVLTVTGSSCGSTIVSNNLTMNVIPTVLPTISISTASTSVCAGSSVIFTAATTNQGTAPSFQWRKNGVPVSSGTNSYTDNGLTSGNVISCVLTSNAVCPSPASVTSNNITMTVNPILTPSVSISTSSTTRCAGQSTTFNASPVNGGTSPVYQWYVNGNPVGTNSAAYTTTTLQNGDVVTCTMNSSVPCPTSTTVTSNALTMTIDSTVVPTISVASNFGTQACVGIPVTFTATVTNEGTAPLYQWRQNGLPVGTNSSTYTAILTANSTVNCILTSTATCAIPASITSNTLSMILNQVTKATIAVVPTPDSVICTPNTGILFYTVYTNGGSNNKYQWIKNGVDVTGETQSTFFSNTLDDNDIISCRFSSSNICVLPETSQGVTMRKYPMVVPGVTIKMEDLGGNTIRFTANIVNGGPNPRYQWRRNGISIPNETNSVYTVTGLSSNDRISVELISDAVCAIPKSVISNDAMTTTSIQVVATGVNHIGLYPNPATEGVVFLTTDKTLKGNTEIRILDRLGSVVYSQNNIDLNTTTPTSVNIGNLAAGMYIMQVINTTENVKTNIRFNKQ